MSSKEGLIKAAMVVLKPLSSEKKDFIELSETLISMVENGHSQNLVKKMAHEAVIIRGLDQKVADLYALGTRSLTVLRRDSESLFFTILDEARRQKY